MDGGNFCDISTGNETRDESDDKIFHKFRQVQS